MTLARLRELLEAYGADARRWPASERDAARALIAASAEAQRLAAAAGALDAALERHPPAPAPRLDPAELAARIAARPRPSGTVAEFRRAPAAAWRPSFGWPNLAGLAAAALAGFIVGWTGLVAPPERVDDEVPAIFLFEDP